MIFVQRTNEGYKEWGNTKTFAEKSNIGYKCEGLQERVTLLMPLEGAEPWTLRSAEMFLRYRV